MSDRHQVIDVASDSLKLKRPQTAKKYRAELDQLYAEALGAEEQANSKVKARL